MTRFAKMAAAAAVLGMLQLAFGWRLSISGVSPDVLFVLAAYATLGLRPVEGVPVACAVGLAADLLVGSRLGLQALGYGVGSMLVDGLRPLVARWSAASAAARGPGWAGLGGRALAVFVLVLAGAGGAHGTVAAVGYVAGGLRGALGGRVLLAAGISFLSALAAPVVWAALAVTVGDVRGASTPRSAAARST